MTSCRQSEGLKAARFLMVLSSISPLFVLWAIRGNHLIPDPYFLGACAFMVVLPNAALGLRVLMARRVEAKCTIAVGNAEDHREHLLVYLFAMLLPFYAVDLGTWRDLASALAALCFIVFLFWHLNLHYMNILLAVMGFHVFTVYSPEDENRFTGRSGQVLITRRAVVTCGEQLAVYRLSDTVYLEVEE